jgi:hypothetical protein
MRDLVAKTALIAVCTMLVFAVSTTAQAGHWSNSPTAGNSKQTLSASGITGPVGYLTGRNVSAGSSAGTYGTDIGGTVGVTPGQDAKQQDNTLEQKWLWIPNDPEHPENDMHEAGKVSGELLQNPSGMGMSVVKTVPGTPEEPGQTGCLASIYVSKVHNMTYSPATGTQHEAVKLSLAYSLNNTDVYVVTETVSHWKRDIDVAENVNTVRLTALSRANSSVNAELVTVSKDGVQGNADVRLALTLTLPEPPGEPEEE